MVVVVVLVLLLFLVCLLLVLRFSWLFRWLCFLRLLRFWCWINCLFSVCFLLLLYLSSSFCSLLCPCRYIHDDDDDDDDDDAGDLLFLPSMVVLLVLLRSRWCFPLCLLCVWFRVVVLLVVFTYIGCLDMLSRFCLQSLLSEMLVWWWFRFLLVVVVVFLRIEKLVQDQYLCLQCCCCQRLRVWWGPHVTWSFPMFLFFWFFFVVSFVQSSNLIFLLLTPQTLSPMQLHRFSAVRARVFVFWCLFILGLMCCAWFLASCLLPAHPHNSSSNNNKWSNWNLGWSETQVSGSWDFWKNIPFCRKEWFSRSAFQGKVDHKLRRSRRSSFCIVVFCRKKRLCKE